jgi:hypothetical protein
MCVCACVCRVCVCVLCVSCVSLLLVCACMRARRRHTEPCHAVGHKPGVCKPWQLQCSAVRCQAGVRGLHHQRCPLAPPAAALSWQHAAMGLQAWRVLWHTGFSRCAGGSRTAAAKGVLQPMQHAGAEIDMQRVAGCSARPGERTKEGACRLCWLAAICPRSWAPGVPSTHTHTRPCGPLA